MTVNEVMQQEFEAIRDELISAYDAKGMRSSGEWADALEVKVSESGNRVKGAILGLPYSQQLETGRAPGKQPPSKAIEKWIYEKGISASIEGKISISSLAYLIARKIAREGWKREQYGGVELISEVITPQRIQAIIDKVSDIYISRVSTELVTFLKQAA
ncbi:hypothetical protein [Flavobacterium coralii]|uniref:hypothetical protein n=1 Tax=Flavobacterium coralii TaxID=2838017 RepID=UPI000C4BA1BE|nr:hypothetical protein [Flavobacterium sp.]|tara:strand:- start:19624 stop:20100 length:477 start_codon:yes stop_codon:yes gene_type:complete